MSEEKSFEQALQELEQIVLHLERGDVPLEQAIQYFKKGMDVSNVCHTKLKTVEAELEQLIAADGSRQPFTLGE
ncbi:MAG: exodeoxyribonuclease VII small subunit [Bacilli bacterium]